MLCGPGSRTGPPCSLLMRVVEATEEEVRLEGHPAGKNFAPTPDMKPQTDYFKPARTAPGTTRSVLPLMTQRQW